MIFWFERNGDACPDKPDMTSEGLTIDKASFR